MDICLLASRKDIAGMNIARYIHSNLQSKVKIVEAISIYSDEVIADRIPSNALIIYLSRHSAQSLRPSFTVHSIGNYRKAEFGGKDCTLVGCHSFLMKKLLLNINELRITEAYKPLFDYETSLEVTHHGPFSIPSIVFIEIGSSEPQWNDLEACRLIADAINNIMFNKMDFDPTWISVIGFGGNHYATKFTQYMLESEYAFGHICAKYAIPSLTKALIHQMIQKTFPTPKFALFDKKSMKRKQQIRTWLSELEIEVIQV
ncbi:MAG: D-aminoacyl-tRNA deacylase [Promethearchaeota archaeon]